MKMQVACASSLLPAYLYHTAHGHLYRNVYIIKITEEFRHLFVPLIFIFSHVAHEPAKKRVWKSHPNQKLWIHNLPLV
jgi:hypothetical protein